jgi:hypothetical protein
MLAVSGARPARFFICPVFFLLKRDIFGALVLTQGEINRMAHLPGACPFRELHFRDELRFDPGRNGFVFRRFSER